MYVLLCQSGVGSWRVEFSIDDGVLSALLSASLHAARVLLNFVEIEVTLYGHGVNERYTKKHISSLLDAIDTKQLPYKTPHPHQHHEQK